MRALYVVWPAVMLFATFSAACGASPDPSTPDDDGGNTQDTGIARSDAGGSFHDSGSNSDGATTKDSGGSNDGGAASDAALQWSAAYTPAWTNFSPSHVPWASVTHLMHFAVIPKSDGSLDTHWFSSGSSAAMCAAAHQNKRLCMLTVGGYGFGSGFSGATANSVRATFEKNLISYMTTNGYDGIDLDWEDNMVASQYLALAQELHTTFSGMKPTPLLTMAHECWINVDATMFQVVDRINVMSYGTTVSKMAGELSCYSGVPHSKMGIGMGLAASGVDKTPADVTAKCQYAASNGYGGVMQWTLDDDYTANGASMTLMAAVAPFIPPP